MDETSSAKGISAQQNMVPLPAEKTSAITFGKETTETGAPDKTQNSNKVHSVNVNVVVETSSNANNQSNNDSTEKCLSPSENCKVELTNTVKNGQDRAARPHPKRPYRGRKAFPWKPSN